jgi:hypothetical protein
MATSLEKKNQDLLNSLMCVLRDRIRESLVSGTFFYSNTESVGSVSQAELLTQVRELVDVQR